MLRLCRIDTEFIFFIDSLCSLEDRILIQGAILEDLKGELLLNHIENISQIL